MLLIPGASCVVGTVSTRITLVVKKDMDAPVYVYYRLDRYFQNHKKYIKSVSYSQLHGTPGASTTDCDTKETVDFERLNDTTIAALPKGGFMNPCGLAAWSYFNDTFGNFTLTTRAGEVLDVSVDSSDLVWEADRSTLFGNYASVNHNTVPGLEGGGKLIANVSQSEHFMAWMKISASPSALLIVLHVQMSLDKPDRSVTKRVTGL